MAMIIQPKQTLLGLLLTAAAAAAAQAPSQLQLVVRDGESAPGTAGVFELPFEVFGFQPVLIDDCGLVHFASPTTDVDQFFSLREGVWSGDGTSLFDIAVDGQVLPGFTPDANECTSGSKTCGEIFNTLPFLFANPAGELLIRTTREDDEGTIAYLDGTSGDSLTPILRSTDSVAFPFDTLLALKTEGGEYLAGPFIGSNPFGEPQDGLTDFVSPLLGGPAPLLANLTVDTVAGTVASGAGVTFGFNQLADRLYVIQFLEGGEALYLEPASASPVLLARTDETTPGIDIGSFTSFTSLLTVGLAGTAQINNFRQGFFQASWRNPSLPAGNTNLPRLALWRFDEAGDPELVVSEYLNIQTDPIFNSSEFKQTAFDDISLAKIAANGTVWFQATGRRVPKNGVPDTSDERSGLWRSVEGGFPELMLRVSTSDAPGSPLPNGPNVPGTELPGGEFFRGLGPSGYALDEYSNVVFTTGEGVYVDDERGLSRITFQGEDIEVASNDFRTVDRFLVNSRGFIGGASPAYRNGRLALTLRFEDNSVALFRTDEVASCETPFVVNSVADRADEDLQDGLCDTGELSDGRSECTLRAALQEAMVRPGKDRIRFAIPDNQADQGIYTIALTSNLPIIEEPVIIDAATQLGYRVGNPVIALQAAALGTAPSWGFDIRGGDSLVRGFHIHSVSKNAVRLQDGGNNIVQGNRLGSSLAGQTIGEDAIAIFNSPDNIVGGNSPAKRNVISSAGISGTGGVGIRIDGAAATNNRIVGNYVGTEPTGLSAAPNGSGGVLLVNAPGNFVGGGALGEGNLISGNIGHGIQLQGAMSTGNVIRGNVIGLNASLDAPLGNSRSGIWVLPSAGENNTIGGLVDSPGIGDGNIISGNTLEGIRLSKSGQTVLGNVIGTNLQGDPGLGNQANGIRIQAGPQHIGNGAANGRNVVSGNAQNGILIESGAEAVTVAGNYIGVDIDGDPRGNSGSGIAIDEAFNNHVGPNNVIQSNTGDGILITASTAGHGNVLTNNSLYLNGELGIDLGGEEVTPNDSSDSDSGPNRLQNFPVIQTVTGAPVNRVGGTLESTPNRSFIVEVYTSPMADGTGHGEGRTFEGAFPVETGSDGNGSFSVGFGMGQSGDCVSATARDEGSGDTSEFSECIVIPDPQEASLDFGDAPEELGYPTTLLSNGARHVLATGLFLGSGADAETDGQPTADAEGDDNNGSDDEDGVALTDPLNTADPLEAVVEVMVSGSGSLNAWIDFNQNGNWEDEGEQVFTNEPLASGTSSLTVAIPAGTHAGTTYARFRLSTQTNLGPIGPALDGEVEDYVVVIAEPPFFADDFGG